MTSKQRLAWAREHGITPPSFAKEALVSHEVELSDLDNEVDLENEGSCHDKSTRSKLDKSCCSTKSENAKSLETAKYVSLNACSHRSITTAVADDLKTKHSSRNCCDRKQEEQAVGLVVQAMKCRGTATGFISLPWYKIYQNAVPHVVWRSSDELLPWCDIHATSFVSEINTPPPRYGFFIKEA